MSAHIRNIFGTFIARAIIFDMDGTLVQSNSVVERTWRNWALKFGLDSNQVIRFAHGVPTIETVRRFAPPGTDTATEARQLIIVEENDTEGIVAIERAAEFIATIPNDRWGIVTSATRKLASRRLEAAGIPFPRVLITAEDVRNGKPDPEGYIAAACGLKVSASECIVFEDAPAGVHAALSAAAKVVVVDSTGNTQIHSIQPTIVNFNDVEVLFQCGQLQVLRSHSDEQVP